MKKIINNLSVTVLILELDKEIFVCLIFVKIFRQVILSDKIWKSKVDNVTKSRENPKQKEQIQKGEIKIQELHALVLYNCMYFSLKRISW